jgi:hypothetical protein
MQSPQDTVVTYDGRPMLVSTALKHMLNGGDAAVVTAQPAQQPGQPGQGQPGAPGLTISQRAADALSQKQYDELKQTGHIQGLTNSDNGRAMISMRNSSGTVQSRFSFDPETGKVEPGRPIDLRDFDAPAE